MEVRQSISLIITSAFILNGSRSGLRREDGKRSAVAADINELPEDIITVFSINLLAGDNIGTI